MTDFLTRLAERALGVAPVAHPLIPSLYAPDVNGLLSELAETEDDSTPATKEPSALDATGPSPPVLGPADAAGRHSADPFGWSAVADSIRHDATPSEVASAPTGRTSADPSSGRRPPLPAGTTPARSPVADREHRGHARVPPIVPERPVVPGAKPPVTPSVRRALPATSSLDETHSWRPLGPRVVANETASLAVREPRDSGPSAEVTDLGAGPLLRSTPKPARRSSRPGEVEPYLVMPRPDAFSSGPSRDGAPPPLAVTRQRPSLEVPPAPTAAAPTIRVTIGRIEVRAAAPPAPPEPEPTHRPEPALSLDDYLKGRREAVR